MTAKVSTQHRWPAIEMRGAGARSMRDPGITVAEGVNWTVQPGEFWVIAGPQRGGKTDFLMMAAGLSAPEGGAYRAFDSEMPIFEDTRLKERLRLGFVFDGGKLFDHLTMIENVALPISFHENLPANEARARAEKLLEAMDVMTYADRTPSTVAWHWQQRAGLARALALKPELLLLDNPLVGLDPRNAAWWLNSLGALNRGHALTDGKPVTIVVTAQDFWSWRNQARSFAALIDRQLRVLGDWEALERCEDEAVRELVLRPEIDRRG